MTTPDPEGLAAARKIAGYHIGDPSWANVIIDAYLHPSEALAELEEEMD